MRPVSSDSVWRVLSLVAGPTWIQSGRRGCIYQQRVRKGCRNSFAINFDAAVTVDDGSCVMPKTGCISPHAANYDSSATSCIGATCECVFLRRGALLLPFVHVTRGWLAAQLEP
eukprot:5614391-Prymnesium_polylepis.1